MTARKAISTPKKRVRELRERLGLSAKANPNRRFWSLYDKTWRPDILREAWRLVAANGGAPGVDGASIQWIKEYGVDKFLEELGEELRTGGYRPDNILRVHIPKDDGRMRPLGIPTVTDRVAQMAVKLVVEPLFEADFLPCSYGFRPGRSAHDAIRVIDDLLRRGYRWVVDVDLKSYFDTIHHERLLELVRRRVIDRKILRLIRLWLKAGILEKGRVTYPELGSPQGGVLSPLLANIYLHEVDREWRRRAPRAVLVRYADDMLILCPTEADAQREYARLQTTVEELGLTLNAEKTRVTAVRDGFDFLGFSFRPGCYTRNGRRKETTIKVPRAKAGKSLRARIKETVRDIHLGDSLAKAVGKLNAQLRGWVNYFRISNLKRFVDGLVNYACSQLRLHLRRRFHRKRGQYGDRWPDSMFHDSYGLYRATQLLSRG